MAGKTSTKSFVWKTICYTLTTVGWICVVAHTNDLGGPEAGNTYFELGVLLILLGFQLRG